MSRMTEWTDEQLMQRLCAGMDKSEALAELMRRHSGLVSKVAFGILRNAEEAQDVCSEVWIAVVQQACTWKPTAKLSSWLCGIARYKAFSYARARRPTESLQDLTEHRWEPASPGTDLAEQIAIKLVILDCLWQLERLDREIVILRDVMGFSFREIGVRVNMTENTATQRYHRCKPKLKHCLDTRLKEG